LVSPEYFGDYIFHLTIQKRTFQAGMRMTHAFMTQKRMSRAEMRMTHAQLIQKPMFRAEMTMQLNVVARI
jgi:hypothetical protein